MRENNMTGRAQNHVRLPGIDSAENGNGWEKGGEETGSSGEGKKESLLPL